MLGELALAQQHLLDRLRESGVTNMFGASPYLQEEYDIDRVEARRVLGLWRRTFDRESSAFDRAKKALGDGD